MKPPGGPVGLQRSVSKPPAEKTVCAEGTARKDFNACERPVRHLVWFFFFLTLFFSFNLSLSQSSSRRLIEGTIAARSFKAFSCCCALYLALVLIMSLEENIARRCVLQSLNDGSR